MSRLEQITNIINNKLMELEIIPNLDFANDEENIGLIIAKDIITIGE